MSLEVFHSAPFLLPPGRLLGARRFVRALVRGGLAPLLLRQLDDRNIYRSVTSEFVTSILVMEAAPGRRGPKRRQGGALQGGAQSPSGFLKSSTWDSAHFTPSFTLSPADHGLRIRNRRTRWILGVFVVKTPIVLSGNFACFFELFESCKFSIGFIFSLQATERHEKLVMDTRIRRF